MWKPIAKLVTLMVSAAPLTSGVKYVVTVHNLPEMLSAHIWA